MPNNIKPIKPLSTGTRRFLGFVLVVDDEELNRTLLRDPLEALGYEVEEAEDGAQALEKIAAHPPDVILLDLMMPKMDGLEVCRQLKTFQKTAHIPILMVTALWDRKERLMGIAVGANDFLTKPVDIQDVTLRVSNAVYTKMLHDQLQREQEKCEQLLLNFLPKHVVALMKLGETTLADSHPDTTILLADLGGIDALPAQIDPAQVVKLLNEVYSAFDLLAGQPGLEKIKTLRGAYLVAGGMSAPRPDHAEAIAELALSFQEEVERLNHQYHTTLSLRIGVSSGPVTAGVMGRNQFAYDVWGETVNLAYRMESTAGAGTIQISEATHERLKGKYHFQKQHSAGINGMADLPAYGLAARGSAIPPRWEPI